MKYLFILLLFASCTNHAYKMVATDVQRSEKHTLLMAEVCAREYPCTPGKIKRDTVTTVTEDTAQVNALNQVLSDLYIYMAEHCGNFDTAKIEALVKSRIKPGKNKEMHYYDSIPYEDKARIDQISTQLNDKSANLVLCQKENEGLKQAKNKFLKYLWIENIILLLSVIGAVYVKFRLSGFSFKRG